MAVCTRAVAVATLAVAASVQPALAQDAAVDDAQATDQEQVEETIDLFAPRIPEGLSDLRFVNPRARVALPEPMPGPVLRFVVADDFPPFAFIDGQGRLAGVHIDLVRALCATIELPCTLQARRFEQVLGAVEEDPDNLVLAAGLAVSDDLGEDLSFSLPYYRYAARFISLRETAEQADWQEDARVGVIEQTAHAAFLRDAFDDMEAVTYPNQAALLSALQFGEVTHAFGDGLAFAFWLVSDRANDCCAFVGPPIFSAPYFGEGLAFAVPRGQPSVVQALNAGLIRLEGSGELEAIMLTAFPLDPLGP